ncbi:hypothetical protein Zm00014a_010765 [Zea mays]|jgi:hypothetical protein|uniref:Late embryogenesis abundant (LEA) hydroxyproline-rich glycoprotein family n=2 Tax=Zea mays TaxID=4577 RepID=A0A1D6HDN3_MAIZE|nr:Late embryogenesis abundant (LEA) hydroxyproline-rich glycoprotein family [Zea mays]PWZ23660.1 hypothetical protein Zm00014a_010765 [Zea mays]|eukprot:XP_008645955.1 NDR1/HIN1-like protein 10 [Zea mays]
MPPEAASSTGHIVARIRRPLPAERPHVRRCTRLLCSAFLTVLLVAGVVLFVVYLAVRPHRPRFHVTAFSASGIGPSSGGTVSLSGQLSIRNPNRDIAFFYDRFYLSVEYRGADVVKGQALTAAPLYQPPKTTSALAFQGVAASAASGDMARDAVEAGGRVELTVKVRSRIRARLAFWGNRHWHPLHVGCEVAVGPDGQLLAEYMQKRCSIDFF